MEMYGFKQKKKKKWWFIPIIAAAAVMVVILTVGIIVNITNADHSAIAKSVRENADLKRQIETLNEQIKSLNEELLSARDELDARPTSEPEPTVLPEGEPQQNQGEISPRNFSQ